MVGYWPSSIFCFCFFGVFMNRNRVEVYENAINTPDPVILTERAWSVKEEPGLFSCPTQWVILNGQDNAILPARVANHSAGFILPARGASHVIKYHIANKP